MSVLGEILLTVGVVTLLYVVWQLWIGDLIIGAQKSAEAATLSQKWDAVEPDVPDVAASAPQSAA